MQLVLFAFMGAAGRLDLLGGGVSEDVSYAVYQESYQERVEPSPVPEARRRAHSGDGGNSGGKGP